MPIKWTLLDKQCHIGPVHPGGDLGLFKQFHPNKKHALRVQADDEQFQRTNWLKEVM